MTGGVQDGAQVNEGQLGLATAKKSILQFILKKWGEIIGAKTLEALAVRRVGPNMLLEDLDLYLDVVRQG